MSENIHDKGYKRILSKKKHFLNLLKDFVNESWVFEINEDDLEIIDKEFIPKDFKEKEADIIYKLKYGDKEIIFYCLLELQSRTDFTMPFRLLIYMLELMKRLFSDTEESIRERADFRLPAVVPIVLYNGADKWTAVKSFKEYSNGYELFGDRLIDFKYILLNINNYENEALNEIGNLISSIFLLDKTQDIFHLTSNFDRIVKIFQNLTEDEQIDFVDWLKDVLIKKVKSAQKELVNKAIEYFEKGEVNNMTYAIERMFDEVEQKGIEKGKLEGLQEGLNKGLQEGLQEGLHKGLQEGLNKGLQEGTAKIAIKMIKKGRDIYEIQEFTDLTIEEIIELREESAIDS